MQKASKTNLIKSWIELFLTLDNRAITISAYGEGHAPKFTNTNDSMYNGNAIQLNGNAIIGDRDIGAYEFQGN